MSHHHAERGGRRTSGSRSRVEQFDSGDTFLIVCEGKRTEPNYFIAFRVSGDIRTIDVKGEGYNTESLVRRAIELAGEEEYDQVWCVFDRDSFPAQSFNNALALADRHGFHVAYSNEAFELWYLLHFNYYNAGISRTSYCERLSGLLGREYRKNDPSIYRQLLSRQPDAIRNAKLLLSQYQPLNPVRDNPSTKVFELVEALNSSLENIRRAAASE